MQCLGTKGDDRNRGPGTRGERVRTSLQRQVGARPEQALQGPRGGGLCRESEGKPFMVGGRVLGERRLPGLQGGWAEEEGLVTGCGKIRWDNECTKSTCECAKCKVNTSGTERPRRV